MGQDPTPLLRKSQCVPLVSSDAAPAAALAGCCVCSEDFLEADKCVHAAQYPLDGKASLTEWVALGHTRSAKHGWITTVHLHPHTGARLIINLPLLCFIL